MIEQPELICFECKLDDCIPEHKDCLWRLTEKHHSVKKRLYRMREAIKNTKAELQRMEVAVTKLAPNRKAYLRRHYLLNRDKKLAAANARAARLREAV